MKKNTSKTVHISVSEIVEDDRCIAAEDGRKVYRRIYSAIKRRDRVVLSFRDVNFLTTSFLSVAIGNLYGKFTEKEIRRSLKIEDLAQDDMDLIDHVADYAKRYFKDPDAYNRAMDNAMDG